MNNSEAWDIVSELRGAIERERYALYYVGMMDEKDRVLAALDQALQALQQQRESEARG